MSEHIERYRPFAESLCDAGYAVCANDHIGHGATASSEADLGHMPLDSGEDILISDVHALRGLVSGRFADDTGAAVPYVVFGHSMGSFITRVYLTRHAFGVRAAVLCGTGHQPRASPARARAYARSGAVARRALREPSGGRPGRGAYAKAIEGARDGIRLDLHRSGGGRCLPARSALRPGLHRGRVSHLGTLVSHATDARLAARVPRSLPMLFIAGDADPVGSAGRASIAQPSSTARPGWSASTRFYYEGMRHEILNEPGRADVYADVIAWLEDVL